MALFDAIVRGDLDEIRKLGADESARDSAQEDGRTPLMVAACKGELPVLKVLLELGADLNMEDIAGRNAFLWAAAEGHVAIVQELLAADDTQTFTTSKAGNTAVHRAAAYGHAAVVALLLKSEADIDCVNEEGATALSRACRWGHSSVAEILLRAGADPAIADSQGRTAFSWARTKGFTDTLAVLKGTRPVREEVVTSANPDRVQALMAGESIDGDVMQDGEGGEGEDAPGPLRVEGWMAKQGHIIRNWKNRWFVLDGRRMFYFAKEGATRPKGVIRMVKGTEVVVEERYAKPYCFTLITPTKKYILQSASEEEQAEWIEAIQQNLDGVDPEDAMAAGEADAGMDED